MNKQNRTECTHIFLPGGLPKLARLTLDPKAENGVPKGMPSRHVTSIVWAPLPTVKQRRSQDDARDHVSVGKGHSLWLSASREQEHPDATARWDN